MDLNHKKVAIFGLGKTGEALLKRLTPIVSDLKVSSMAGEVANKKIPFEKGEHTFDFIADRDLIVLSPGMAFDHSVLIRAREKGIDTLSEVELAYQYFIKKPIIAITGTNGKTTTTTLLGKILREAGKKVAVCGNIGKPLIEIDDTDLDYIVLEVSSYQLEATVKFKPLIALLLNLDEDHLARHKDIWGYLKAKSRIFLNQDQNSFLIYNADDHYLLPAVRKAKARRIPFSLRKALSPGIFLKAGRMIADLEGRSISLCRAQDLKIFGWHNFENSMAAALAALLLKISPTVIKKTLTNFLGVEHRMEKVAEIKGVTYFNDSKATNPPSTIVALKALKEEQKNIILIAGGRDKGGSLKEFCAEIKESVREVVLLGESRQRFFKALIKSGFKKNQISEVYSLKEAVTLAAQKAQRGERVLLSPACASFDMFLNFEERGKLFKEYLKGLAQ